MKYIINHGNMINLGDLLWLYSSQGCVHINVPGQNSAFTALGVHICTNPKVPIAMAISSSLPTTQSALKVSGSNVQAVIRNAAIPVLEPSEVLVRVVCVSINQVSTPKPCSSHCEVSIDGVHVPKSQRDLLLAF